MIDPKLYDKVGSADGVTLPKYAWPGGYPIVYYAEDGGEFCSDCANGDDGSDTKTQDDPQWNIVEGEVYWEGPPLHCSHCNREIESAYGDPDA